MNKFGKIYKWSNNRGTLWTALYTFRWVLLKHIDFVEKYLINNLEKFLINIEKRRFLTGNGTICSLYHTTGKNRKIWNSYNWAKRGEEWTSDVKRYKELDPDYWKISVINKMMLKYIKKGSTILEVGPGGGRWTKVLFPVANRLLIADISEKCLEICKERFKDHSNIEYYLIKDQGLDFINDNCIDYIWAYDVFVHINPTDTERYIEEFKRILKPGGYGIIHHAGTYSNENENYVRQKMFRSYTDSRFFAQLVRRNNMVMVEQNDSLAHCPGDVISAFTKPSY